MASDVKSAVKTPLPPKTHECTAKGLDQTQAPSTGRDMALQSANTASLMHFPTDDPRKTPALPRAKSKEEEEAARRKSTQVDDDQAEADDFTFGDSDGGGGILFDDDDESQGAKRNETDGMIVEDTQCGDDEGEESPPFAQADPEGPMNDESANGRRGNRNIQTDVGDSDAAAAATSSRRAQSDDCDANPSAVPPRRSIRLSEQSGGGEGVQDASAAASSRRARSVHDDANPPAGPPRRSIRLSELSGGGECRQDDAAADPSVEEAKDLRRIKAEVEKVWKDNGALFCKWTRFSEKLLKSLPIWGIYFIILPSGLILFGRADGGLVSERPLYYRIRQHVLFLLDGERGETQFLIIPGFTEQDRRRLPIVEELIKMMCYAKARSDANMGVFSSEEVMIERSIVENEIAPIAQQCLRRKRRKFSVDICDERVEVDFGEETEILPHR